MKLKKYIFIIDEHMSSKQNGIGTYMQQFVFCMKFACPTVLALISFNADCKDFSIRKNQGVIYYDFPLFAGGDFVKHGGLSLPILRQYVKDREKNVFFVNHSPCADFLKTLRELFPKSKIVFTIHDQGWTAPLLGNAEYLKMIVGFKNETRMYESHLPAFVSRETRAYVRSYFKEEQRMYKMVDAVICLSLSTQNLVETIYGISKSKVHLIPNGIELANFNGSRIKKKSVREQLNISEADKVFLFVGRTVKAKGIEVLLKAFEKISFQYPECHLVIAGECHHANELVRLAPHACTRITFTGLVSKNEMALWYTAADCGVLPSYTEQCSYAGLEMVAYGLPVITTDGNGLVDMFTDGVNAIVAEIGNREEELTFVERISSAIKRVLWLSDAEKQCYVQKALNLVKSQYTAIRMQKLYCDLLANL